MKDDIVINPFTTYEQHLSVMKMKDDIIINPSLTYDRYTTYQQQLSAMNMKDGVYIDAEDLYKQLRPTYFPSSHGMDKTHAKEWVIQEALILVVNIIVRELIARGSFTGPLNVLIEEIVFNPPTNNWDMRTKGDVELHINSNDLSKIYLVKDSLPESLISFDTLTAVTLADILNDVDNAMIEFMTKYKPVTPQQALVSVLDRLRNNINANTDVAYLGGVVHLGIEHLIEVLKSINRENEK